MTKKATIAATSRGGERAHFVSVAAQPIAVIMLDLVDSSSAGTV
jgi:hypothetical protein